MSDQELLQQAAQLWLKRGGTDFTIDRLSEVTGISRATLYRRLGSRDAILQRLVADHAIEIEELAQPDVRTRIMQATGAELNRAGFGGITVEKISDDESDAYFATRPLESRWSVYASRQSDPVESRQALDSRYDVARLIYGDSVPRPQWWGGYRVIPDEFEFWQGRPSRLHDRIHYRKQPDGLWVRTRLAP